MLHHQQTLNFSHLLSLLDLQTLLWLTFAQNQLHSLKNHIHPSPNHFQNAPTPVKIEENQQIQTQKHQINSSIHQILEKKQYFTSKEEQISAQNDSHTSKNKSQSNVIQRNQTKNISKNFGKAILSFAKTNSKFSKKLLKKYNVDKQDLVSFIKKARKDLNSLQDLREMWGAEEEEDELKKCLRIISHHFMRKHCLAYIYNSRIKSVSAHTKYRHRLMEGMRCPSEFRNIKLN